MKNSHFILSVVFLFIGLPTFAKSNFASLFAGKDACFVMAQISTGKTIESYNPKRCAERFSPNSTFKIPTALMAFEKGILKDEAQIIKWDGTHNSREELNQDQTPLAWMDRSVVWVTQWITLQLKEDGVTNFLKEFEYGNRDFSGGVTKAWLDSSLKVSADEQVTFLTKFWLEKLPLSKSTFEKTKKIIFISKIGQKSELYGKTGTGFTEADCEKKPGQMRGWFVGVIKTSKDAYVFAANATDLKPESTPAGPRLRKAIIEVFNEMSITE